MEAVDHNSFVPYKKQPYRSTQIHYQCHRLNLSFNYSNPRHKTPQPLSYNVQAQRSVQHFSRTHYPIQIPQSPSNTFYPHKQKSPRMNDQSMHLSQSTELDYIKCGFPQRRKKTGEQQLLKLLLKFAQNDKIKDSPPKQLFEQSSREMMKPKLKNRTGMNWMKQRYCLNRDKQMGMFPDGDKSRQFGEMSSRIK